MSTDPIFRLELAPVDPDRTPLLCALSVIAAGETVWPVAGEADCSVEVPIDDIFAHLAEFWKPLLLRQTYPFALAPARPNSLVTSAENHWANAPQEQVDEEATELDHFEEAHNLALAFGGLFDLPPLWLVREGDEMLCDTGRSLTRLPFAAVLRELTAVGDKIAEQLVAVNSDKWQPIVDVWKARDTASEVSLVAWSASIDSNVAAELISNGLIEAPKSFAQAANDDDELLIAARVAGALPTEQIVQILEVARGFSRHEAPKLDAISSEAMYHLGGLKGLEPFAEGEALANFVREKLDIGPSETVDIFGCADYLGIEVRIEAVGPGTFDGLAIAGSRFGPGAFINRNSGRVRDKNSSDLSVNPGARVTLAHELCHLLIDRSHPLSAVEVLRSRMPSKVESRARAFAGEFLLPSATAAKIWNEVGSPIEQEALEAVLQRLADTYGVSFSVASRKVQHGARWGLESGGSEHFRQLRAALDSLALYR